MSKNREFVYRMSIVVLLIILIFTLVQSPRATQAAPQAAGAQLLGVTVFNVVCRSLEIANTTFTKLADLGTFTVHSSDSILELIFNGRIFAANFSEGVHGVYFELRVDGVASSIGRARAVLRSSEISGDGVYVSFTGMFSGLAAGAHTASMYVRTSTLTASGPAQNPGCYDSDVLIVKEYLPFGVTYMPLINK